MLFLGIDKSDLSGPARSAGYFLDFDTFRTLEDGEEYFARAMQVELEHGRAAGTVGADVTRDDPVLTAQIVKAHLWGVEAGKPSSSRKPTFPAYYDFLLWMEKCHERWLEARQPPPSSNGAPRPSGGAF